MTRRDDDLQPLIDPLGLAEATAAGRLTDAAAEATLRAVHAEDARRADAAVAEFHALTDAIRGIRQHADATARMTDDTARPAGSMLSESPFTETVVPRRVDPGEVHLRRSVPSGRPRWALPGALAAAVVVFVAVALAGSTLFRAPTAASGSPSSIAVATPSDSTPSASQAAPPSTSPTTVPSTAPSLGPTPNPTGVAGVPTIPSSILSSAPGVATWTLSPSHQVVVTEWRPDGGKSGLSLSLSTWPDPDLAAGDVVERTVVVSPDGWRTAFAETTADRTRLRVFDGTGALLWTDPDPVNSPDLVWSTDGVRLAVGGAPATWRILTFAGPSAKPTVATLDFHGAAYALLGFSRSTGLLYGYETTGEAEYWQTPFVVDRAGGTPTAIDGFAGQADPLVATNGTTPTSGTAITSLALTQPGIDPVTGRVLDRGGLSGSVTGWEIRLDRTTAVIFSPSSDSTALAWNPDGTIVDAEVRGGRAMSIYSVAPDAPAAPLGPVFRIADGSYWRAFTGAHSGYGLLALAAARTTDATWLGADELVMVDLATGESAVLVASRPGSSDPASTGLHVAGWIDSLRQ